MNQANVLINANGFFLFNPIFFDSTKDLDDLFNKNVWLNQIFFWVQINCSQTNHLRFMNLKFGQSHNKQISQLIQPNFCYINPKLKIVQKFWKFSARYRNSAEKMDSRILKIIMLNVKFVQTLCKQMAHSRNCAWQSQNIIHLQKEG